MAVSVVHECEADHGEEVPEPSAFLDGCCVNARRNIIFANSEALVAQLDRAPDFESGGREFESLRARQYFKRLKLAGDFERLGAKVCLILGRSAPHVTGAVMLGYFGRR